MEVAGREIKRVTLELGGSDPMIVMEDANLDLAVKMADVGRYFNCGQMCLGVKRLFLQESIADNFVGGLVEILKKKTVGNGMSKETRMGPIHLGSQRQEVEEQVEDAKARGAKLLFGGERPKGGDFDKGFFYLPTLMTNVPDDARMTKEEVFGPALPVYTFKTSTKRSKRPTHRNSASARRSGRAICCTPTKRSTSCRPATCGSTRFTTAMTSCRSAASNRAASAASTAPKRLDYYLEPKGVVVVNV